MIKNKMTITGMLLFICLISTNAMAYELPAECKKILDTKFSGWKMATPMKEVTEFYETEKNNNPPNLIKGDYDGDAKADYAALIQYGTESVDGNPMPKIWTIAFLKTARGYSYHKLEGGDYIQTVKKGKKDFNVETNKKFTHKNDAIFSAIWEKTGTSYIWFKGKFKSVITSD